MTSRRSETDAAASADPRAAVWPFLEDRRQKKREARSREDILATLMRSRQSIELNLTEIRKQFENNQKPGGTR